MAGDWIKMRTNLDTDVRVIEIADALNMTELHVVGCLWKLWSWADQHTHDGNAIRVTHVTLDRFTGVTGFANSLRDVGWLVGEDGALSFPRFSEHNGQTAKNRAETKVRVAKHRNAKSVTDVTQNVLPEKRREEKRREYKNKQTDFANSEYLKDQEFADLFGRFRQSSADNHHWVVSEMTAEAWLMELANLSLDDAKAALRFSTGAGAKKPITNGDHSRKQASDHGGKRSRKCVSFEEGLLQ